MEEARELISVFREINGTRDRNVAQFTPALIGLFGSARLFDVFLASLDKAFSTRNIPAPLKERVTNLARTFIPQVAGLNGIAGLSAERISAEQLRTIRTDSPGNRKEGMRVILSALLKILDEAKRLG